MKIAIVGAGWAGMAAASQCLKHGREVTVYDAAQTPGGRARAVTDSSLGELDNGQHLLIGAYQNTLALIERDVGQTHLNSRLKRLRLSLQSVDGRFLLKRRHSDIMALWSAKGLRLRDKWRISALLWRLRSNTSQQHRPHSSTQTVEQWLAHENQSANACRWLWHPLCLATMNTEPAKACAILFQNVLRDSFLSEQSGATDLLVPTCNLTELWPGALAKQVKARWGNVVRQITPQTDGVLIEGERYDACVLAIPPINLSRLTLDIPEFAQLIDDLSKFEFRSIATCYVSVREHQPLPGPVLMFDHAALSAERPAQWVFDRSQFMQSPPQAQLAFVMSCADTWASSASDDHELAKQLLNQLKNSLPSYTGKLVAARCFREKRATFAAVPGLLRPTTTTWHPRIMLAGDWVDTGYPSVIEGAVISGIKAADQIAAIETPRSDALAAQHV